MRVLRRHEVAILLGVSLPTLGLWSKRPGFPPTVRLGPNSVGWLEADLEQWLKSLRCESAGGASPGEAA